MSLLHPETPEEKFEDNLRKLAFECGFVPNWEWTRKVTMGLFAKYNITEKEGGEVSGTGT